MSLAQCKSSKRYRDKHRAEHLIMCKRNYRKNKEKQLKASYKRTLEISKGAKRWRETVGPNYWDLKQTGY